MKQIYVTNNEVELQMLIGPLESQGIFAQVQTDGAGDYFRIKGSDFMLYKRVLVRDEDWQTALSIAKNNGFEQTKKIIKRDKAQIWIARIALVIFLAAILGSILGSLFNNL